MFVGHRTQQIRILTEDQRSTSNLELIVDSVPIANTDEPIGGLIPRAKPECGSVPKPHLPQQLGRRTSLWFEHRSRPQAVREFHFQNCAESQDGECGVGAAFCITRGERAPKLDAGLSSS
jgi:hypothetical protein